MLTVCVAGATGWTGQPIAQAIIDADDLTLRSAVARSVAGVDLGTAWGGDALGIPVYGRVAEALDGVDVLVDYTSHHAVKANGLLAVRRGVHVVIGASGGTADDLAERLAQVRRPYQSRPLDQLAGLRQARGATVAGAQVHSVRLPSFVVSTEVVFGLPDERLVIRHDAGMTPTPYVTGTLLAVRAVPGRVGLTRGLDTLLLSA